MLSRGTLGRNDLQVTQLGLGCAPLGDLFEVIPEAESVALLQTAWDSGIRYFDTAPFYGHTKSEHRLGSFLRQQERSEYVLSTKVGRVYRPAGPSEKLNQGSWLDPYPFLYHFDYSYDGIMRSYEDSLQRMGIGSVDVLVIHDLDLLFFKSAERHSIYLAQLVSSGWRALEELRASGAVSVVGAGINELGLIRRFNELMDLDFFLVAYGYNLLNQSMLGEDFTSCNDHNAQIVVGAPFASGILAGGSEKNERYAYKQADPAKVERVARIQKICASYEIPLPAAALQFPMAHPNVVAVIPGATNRHHVGANAQNFSIEIPVKLWHELREQGLLHPDAPIPDDGDIPSDPSKEAIL